MPGMPENRMQKEELDRWLAEPVPRREVIDLAMKVEQTVEGVNGSFGQVAYTVTLLYEALRQGGLLTDDLVKKAVEAIGKKTERVKQIREMKIPVAEKIALAKKEGLDAYFSAREEPKNATATSRPQPS